MNCCGLSSSGLSSTGLNDIDANNITSDNTTIFSNLNVSGFSNWSELLVNNNEILNETIILSSLNISGFATLNNKTSLFSALNVSGFTTLNNKTTLVSSLNVSGFTNLDNTTNINGSLYMSGLNVLETLNSYGTGLSTLNNFRSDNENALITRQSTTFSTLIHVVYPGSEIKFDTVLSKNNAFTQGTGTEYLTKIDSDGKLCSFTY